MIHLIVARIEGETPWIVEAWDEWTAQENERIGEELFAKARREFGESTELREAIVEVSGGFLDSVFLPYAESALEEKPDA